ncbi:MAG: hypothetical protein AB4060_18605 [Crocosphaera sp.]
MSLIHWDKSVFSLHLKEIIEDHNQNGDSSGVVGLGAILLGTIALPAAAKYGRPLIKSVIKTGIYLSYEMSDKNQKIDE